jgi:iron complex outermembrane receptor protein
MGNNRILQFAVRTALAAAAGSAFIPIAYAQQPASAVKDDTALEEVVVTGSRLAQSPNEVSISPITSVTELDIEKQGLTRAEDILNALPSVVAENSSGQSISSNGTASVSLRGLGSERTLVLVNGFRMAPGSGLATSTSSADINQIPAELIQRVDVLTGGASSVYGADAVAGVVNFVLDTHFEGVKITSNYGFGRHNNDNATDLAYLAGQVGNSVPQSTVDAGQNKDFTIVMGSNFADGKGNATVYATYMRTAPAVGYQYDYAGCTLNTPSVLPGPGGLACGGSSTSAPGRFIENGTVGGVSFTTLADQTVGPGGSFPAYNGALDSYNYGALSYLQRQSERWGAGSFITYDINDHASAYSDFMFSRNQSHAQYGPSGAFLEFPAIVNCTDPQLSAAEVGTLCGAANKTANQTQFAASGATGNNVLVYLGRRAVEAGPRTDTYTGTSFREILGVKGKIVDGLTFDSYVQVGINTQNDVQGGYLGQQQVKNALNVLPDPVTGAATCASVLNGNDTNCVPWNVWTPGGTTAAALAYMTVPITYQVTTTEYIADSSVTADLGKWGLKFPTASEGPSINLGGEYRQERYDFQPDDYFETGQVSLTGGGGPEAPVNGEFHVSEVYTEGRLPVLNDIPGAYNLSFDAGYRYSAYTSGYDTNTYKFGVEYAPIKDIKLRGGYNRAVRAPSVGDLFSPAVIGSGGAADPCWGPAVGGLVNGHTQAFCANTGVTAAEFGHILTNPAAQINTATGGNTGLKPEKADTFTYGFVAQPTAIPNLVASVDYYYIRILQTIESLTSNTIINDCGLNGTASLCSLIHRAPGSGSLWFNINDYVNAQEVNIGGYSTKGIDVAASYRYDMGPFGKVSASLSGTRVLNFNVTPITGLGSYDCAGYAGSTCGSPTPHWRHVLNTDWAAPWGGLDFNVRWRYIGPVDSDRVSQNPQLTATYYPGTAHIGGYTYIDLSLAAPIADTGMTVRVGVNNLEDKDPPIVPNGTYTDCPTATCNDNTWVGTYDTLGRYLYAHVSMKF